MPLQAVGARRIMGGPSSGMAQTSAAKRRHGDGEIGKIIFRRSCGELVAGFLSGVVSGIGSAFSVMDIWGMRDDAPLSGRRAATHGRANPPAWPKIQPRSGVMEMAGLAKSSFVDRAASWSRVF